MVIDGYVAMEEEREREKYIYKYIDNHFFYII